jgi:putative sterol carrier protein
MPLDKRESAQSRAARTKPHSRAAASFSVSVAAPAETIAQAAVAVHDPESPRHPEREQIMSLVPETPNEFFTQYVPERFETVKAGVAGKSSAGCLTFRVGELAWSLRVRAGELGVTSGMESDVILQITIPDRDFKAIVVRGAELQESAALSPEQQLLAFKVLTVDAERSALVRGVRGSMAFSINDADGSHKLVVTPGSATPNLENPECRLECLMSDFMDMQTGKVNPMQLAMSGRIRIVGNAQIPMALSGVFV